MPSQQSSHPELAWVQWSPWTDMPDCYKKFCCVENAKFGEAATVEPGQSWRGTQDLAVIDL